MFSATQERLLGRGTRALLFLLALLACAGCSVKRFAVGSMANSLTSGPDVFATDEDPDLVREALPFGLKLLESLLATVPDHRGLLVTCCRGFTQYAFAFVQMDADTLERTDRGRASALRDRALKLYLRARGYGLRGLQLKHRGITERLQTEPDLAVARLKPKELPLIFWTAMAWGSAIALGKDRPDLLGDISAVRALTNRALAIDERYESGAIHEAMIAIEALPEAMGGSAARAREHFRRAVELSGGERVAPYLILAENLSVAKQDRAEFERLLQQALEVDPDRSPTSRLENLVLQRKARALLARQDELFLDTDTTHVEEPR